MKILGIIPARYESSRFPGKPLADIAGKSMIRRVYEQASKSKCLSEVLVATDDERIFGHVIGFGGKACMTARVHRSGTERCAEVAGRHADKYDAVINIQGDEPFIHPEQIDELGSCFADQTVNIATLARRISTQDELHDPNKVKAIFGASAKALYFSRHPVPFLRSVQKDVWHLHHPYFLHVGIYGYRAVTLQKIAGLDPSPLEQAEVLEQLRWLENGFSIHVGITEYDNLGIDTPGDLERAIKLL